MILKIEYHKEVFINYIMQKLRIREFLKSKTKVLTDKYDSDTNILFLNVFEKNVMKSLF